MCKSYKVNSYRFYSFALININSEPKFYFNPCLVIKPVSSVEIVLFRPGASEARCWAPRPLWYGAKERSAKIQRYQYTLKGPLWRSRLLVGVSFTPVHPYVTIILKWSMWHLFPRRKTDYWIVNKTGVNTQYVMRRGVHKMISFIFRGAFMVHWFSNNQFYQEEKTQTVLYVVNQ